MNIPLHPQYGRLRPPFATRPIEALATAIVSALEAEYRGLVVYGFARFGKTYAVRYLCANTSWLSEPFFCARIIVSKTHKRSDGAFFSLWLDSFGLALPERASALDRTSRVCNFLISKCNELGTNLAIVFMDEAQRLFGDDYEHLVTLDNLLTERGYMLFVVFVVQSDFTGTVSEKIYDGNPPPHVRGRFLVRRHQFSGLEGLEAIDHALGRFDDHTEWPPQSGVSYSRHFARKAFEAGWRLRQHAVQLLDKANALRAMHKLPKAWSWPMKSFEVCVNYLLTNIAGKRAEFEGFTDADIDVALEASGFIELELSRGSKKKDKDD